MTKRQVEKQQLHKGQGIAEQLDITLHNRAQYAQLGTLQPRTDDANDDAEDQAGNGQEEGVFDPKPDFPACTSW